jgi:hypothetical protein
LHIEINLAQRLRVVLPLVVRQETVFHEEIPALPTVPPFTLLVQPSALQPSDCIA